VQTRDRILSVVSRPIITLMTGPINQGCGPAGAQMSGLIGLASRAPDPSPAS
jgi:hypothetical protein